MLQERKNAMDQEAQTGVGDAQSQAQAGAEFLDAYAGQGQQDIGQQAVSLSYLTILQNLSDAVVNGKFDPGVFFNTGTQMDLGPEVEVIPVAFKLVWDERDPGGKTVDRYEPGTVEYKEEQSPPNSPRKFPRKINPKTGFEIVETFAYALVLKDHPEAGFLLHTAGVGSMKVYRRWNTMLKQMRLPNGSQAPIFAKSWVLIAESKISKTAGKPYYGLGRVTEGTWVNKELFAQSVLPARESSSQLLLTAPITTADDGADVDET